MIFVLSDKARNEYQLEDLGATFLSVKKSVKTDCGSSFLLKSLYIDLFFVVSKKQIHVKLAYF